MPRRLALLLMLAAWPAVAGVPTVENPREAPVRRTIAVRELWRAGADDEAEYIFGTVITATADPAGNIYLLDSQTQTVHSFGPGGAYRGLTARQGEGPGEINMVYGMRMWDADRVACLQVFPARLIIVRTDGTPDSTVDLKRGGEAGGSAFITVNSFFHLGGDLVCHGSLYDFDGEIKQQTVFLSSFHPDGRERHRFASQPTGYDWSGPITVDEEKDYEPSQRWALGPGGTVYLAPARNDYLIEVRDLDGDLKRRITRDIAPQHRTAEQKERAMRDYTFSSDSGKLPDISYKLSDIEPPLHGLAWRDDLLWVRTVRGWDEDFPSFDIYDAEGRLVEERRYDVPLDGEQDNLVILPGGRLLRIANLRSAQMAASANLKVVQGEDEWAADPDADAVLEVILYEVVDPAP